MSTTSLVTATAIATAVRARRRALGLSRKALAARGGISERYLNLLEKGDANISIGVLERVATALETSVLALLESPDASRMHPQLEALLARMSHDEQETLWRQLVDRNATAGRAGRGLALLGLRGAGKSTIGRKLAERHGLSFVSVTREIEAAAGMSSSDLFALGGPDAYRKLEIEVTSRLAKSPRRMIVETAGGIVGNTEALDIVLAAFTTVWLKASPQEHLARVAEQGDLRPMAGNPRALEHIVSLLGERSIRYARADFAVDTSGRPPEACVAEIEALAQRSLGLA